MGVREQHVVLVSVQEPMDKDEIVKHCNVAGI